MYLAHTHRCPSYICHILSPISNNFFHQRWLCSLDGTHYDIPCTNTKFSTGPLFFVLYMADLADRAVKYGVSLHTYADYTQLYLHFRRNEMHHPPINSSAVSWTSATGCPPTDVRSMQTRQNSLGHCCAALKGSYPMLKLGADTAVACSHVRLLGMDILLDLSVDCHVSRVCVGCFY